MITILGISLPFGWFGRMNGGGPPKTSEIIDRTLCSLAIVMSVFVTGGIVPCIISWSWIVAMLGMGHGQWYSLGKVVKAIAPERLDFVLDKIFGADPRCAKRFENLRGIAEQDLKPSDRAAILQAMEEYGRRKLYWRCASGLALKGLVIVFLPAYGMIANGYLLYGTLSLLSGFLLPAGYMLGWIVYPNSKGKGIPYLNEASAIGEFVGSYLTAVIHLFIVSRLLNLHF